MSGAGRHKVQAFPESTYFRDKVDPSDSSFRLVELRLPRDVSQGVYGPFEYTGADCRDRLARFAAAYLEGLGHLSPREAEKIAKKHPGSGAAGGRKIVRTRAADVVSASG